MAISVGLHGSTLLARRFADAVASQSDMRLAGIAGWSQLDRWASARGYKLVDSAEQLASDCDVFVEVSASTMQVMRSGGPLHIARQQPPVAFTALTTEGTSDTVASLIVPDADTVALARVVRRIRKLCGIGRLYANIITCGAHATESARCSLDALAPATDVDELTSQRDSVFSGLISVCQTRRVIAPTRIRTCI